LGSYFQPAHSAKALAKERSGFAKYAFSSPLCPHLAAFRPHSAIPFRKKRLFFARALKNLQSAGIQTVRKSQRHEG
jgi:hypothetical protein